MSPIIDIQRRVAEAGRIRAGEQVRTGTTRRDGKPATRPAKLQAWRFTSRNRRALDAVASIYGGEVRTWQDAPTGDQFELYTEASEIDVVLPPEAMAFSQYYEEWCGGGCKHRCDGQWDEQTDSPCSCDPDKRTCDPHTRLSAMLAGIPTTGLWRVETKGHYAKAELAGAMEMAQLLTTATGRAVLPAKLRLEHRKVIRDGKTRQFVVPTLDYAVDMAALAAGAAPSVALHSAPEPPAALPAPSAATSPVTPVPRPPAPSLAEQIASVEEPPPAKRRSNAPPPIPPTGLAPRTAAQAEAAAAPDQGPTPRALEPGDAGSGAEPTAATDGGAQAPSPRRRRRVAEESSSSADTEATAAGRAGKPGCITNNRARELVIEATELFPARESRLIFASDVVGHEVRSYLDLTPREGNDLAQALNQERAERDEALARQDGEEPL